jgi:hypothetical protein
MEFGTQVRDRITGFTGTLTGKCSYISGCSQGLVAPKVGADGAFKTSEWFDLQRLEAIEGDVISLDNGATPGADLAAPRR